MEGKFVCLKLMKGGEKEGRKEGRKGRKEGREEGTVVKEGRQVYMFTIYVLTKIFILR